MRFALLLCVVCSAATTLADEAAAPLPPLPPVKAVVARLDDLYRAASSHGKMTMRVATARYTRELTIESWTQGQKRALLVVRAPAREAGVATLRSEEGLWSYAPRADRLVRIPTSLLSDNWMGSHFTNDDLMRETDFAEDYTAALAWQDDGGRRWLILTLTPRPEAPVVWTRLVYHLEPGDYLPARADYYDGTRIARTLTFSDPHDVGGRRVPFTMHMVPADKPGESTDVHYGELAFGVTVEDGLFSQRGLRRMARQ